MNELTHLDDQGQARIVDIGDKATTRRTAKAECVIQMTAKTVDLIRGNAIAKGDVLAVARVAGIMAAKETSRLIPMCHPIRLDSVEIAFEFLRTNSLRVTATALATDRTGVEMEALTAASIAALTVYDMCKSVDREMVIAETKLIEKTGGKSGDFRRSAN